MKNEQLYAPQQATTSDYFLEEPKIDELFNTKNMKTVVLKVYEDENGKKYLDPPSITAMSDMHPSYVYHYPDGREITVSQSILLDKPEGEIQEGYTSTETVYPNFSDRFPYISEMGLYEVTDDEIQAIIADYEARHPDTKVLVEIEKIASKKRNNINDDKESNDKSYKDIDRIQKMNLESGNDETLDSSKYKDSNKYSEASNFNDETPRELSAMFEEENEENKEYKANKL